MSTSLKLKRLKMCTSKCQGDRNSRKNEMPMVECILCNHWHHFECVGYSPGGATSVRGLYICPDCVGNLKEKEKRLVVLEDSLANFHAEFALIRGMWEKSFKPAAAPTILSAAYVALIQENAELKQKLQSTDDFSKQKIVRSHSKEAKSPRNKGLSPSGIDKANNSNSNRSAADNLGSGGESESETESGEEEDAADSFSVSSQPKRRPRGSGPYMCKLCGKRYSSLNSVYRHTKRSHGSSSSQHRYECKVCHVKFTHPKTLKKHMRSLHGQERKNDVSAVDRYRRQYLISKRWTDKRVATASKEVGLLRCDTCRQVFLQRDAMMEHVRLKHPELVTESLPEKSESMLQENSEPLNALAGGLIPKEEPVDETKQSADASLSESNCTQGNSKYRVHSCKDCGASYRSLAKLAQHQFKEHGGPSPHTCCHCDKVFNSDKGLSYHLNHHSNPTYSCPICNLNFIMKAHVSLHQNFHKATDLPVVGKSTLKVDANISAKSAKSESPVKTSEVVGIKEDICFPSHMVSLSAANKDETVESDNFLHCFECDETILGECALHPLQRIHDTEVAPNDSCRAYNSLPAGLSIAKSSIYGAGLGVFADVPILKNMVFGPYYGKLTFDVGDTMKSDYCWQVPQTLSPSFYVDGRDIAKSNWLRFVNCAENDEQQNLTALQYKSEIFYRTLKPIKPGDELLVWYGEEYAKVLGLAEKENGIDGSSDSEKKTTLASSVDVANKRTESESSAMVDVIGSSAAGKRGTDCLTDKMGVQLGKRPRLTPECQELNESKCRDPGLRSSWLEENAHCSSIDGEASNSVGNFTCRLCEQRFTKLSQLRLHVRNHHFLHRCSSCPMRFDSEEKVAAHIRREHELSDSSDEEVECKAEDGKRILSCAEVYTSDEEDTEVPKPANQKPGDSLLRLLYRLQVEEENGGISTVAETDHVEYDDHLNSSNDSEVVRDSDYFVDDSNYESGSEDKEVRSMKTSSKPTRDTFALFCEEDLKEEVNRYEDRVDAPVAKHSRHMRDDVTGEDVLAKNVVIDDREWSTHVGSSEIIRDCVSEMNVDPALGLVYSLTETPVNESKTNGSRDQSVIFNVGLVADDSASFAGDTDVIMPLSVINDPIGPELIIENKFSVFTEMCSVVTTSAGDVETASSYRQSPVSLSEIVAAPVSSLSLSKLVDRLIEEKETNVPDQAL